MKTLNIKLWAMSLLLTATLASSVMADTQITGDQFISGRLRAGPDTNDVNEPNWLAVNGTSNVNKGGVWSYAFGYGPSSLGDYSYALGRAAASQGYASVGIGYNAQVLGDGSSTISTTTSRASYAFGYNATVTNSDYAYAIGRDTAVTADFGMAIGYNASVSAQHALAFGTNAASGGDYSYALGHDSLIVQTSTTDTTLRARGSYAIGESASIDKADYAYALGNAVINADADYSYAIGRSTLIGAGATFSIAMGYSSEVSASAQGATALGYDNTASANYAMALGNKNTVTGQYAVTLGAFVTAQAFDSVVIGRWNVIEGNSTSWQGTDPVFVVGNGTSDTARTNAMKILKDGSVLIPAKGDLSMGSFTAGATP
jgi:hypothetical protein